MKPKLIWNLGNANPSVLHSKYVYDLYYLSINFAKDLGYHTIFYGTHNSPKVVNTWVDECYDVTNQVPYKLYDDIKVWIWYNRNDKYATIDADVFLYNKISYRLNEEISSFKNRVVLRVEDSNIIPTNFQHRTIVTLKEFNKLNPNQIIPTWDFKNTSSLNSGIVSWGVDGEFKKMYCESYAKLREWFLQQETKINNTKLSHKNSEISHFICEHLLYQMVKQNNIPFDDLKSNPNNHYLHYKGGNKFRSKDFIYTVQTLADYHRKRGGGLLKESYQKLLSENKIPNIFYIRDRFQ